MTDGAQQALRRIMEIYSKTTRFALACNASDKIIEPIQSRCAVLRYSKLTDGQILARLQEVVEQERLSVSDDGLEAIIFTAQGDMRQVRARVQSPALYSNSHGCFVDFLFLCWQALNNLQSTNSGFGYINSENVFKVCDEPHPLLVKSMLGHCVDANIDEAYKVVEQLWALGYSPEDIIGNIFRVCKTYQMAEYLKLEFIKVRKRRHQNEVYVVSPSSKYVASSFTRFQNKCAHQIQRWCSYHICTQDHQYVEQLTCFNHRALEVLVGVFIYSSFGHNQADCSSCFQSEIIFMSSSNSFKIKATSGF